jgi:hypothetical protein
LPHPGSFREGFSTGQPGSGTCSEYRRCPVCGNQHGRLAEVREQSSGAHKKPVRDNQALKRRKELQDTIRSSVKELQELEDWLRKGRQFLGRAANESAFSNTDEIERGFKAGHGLTQPVFEQLLREVLLEHGQPMQSGEVIEAFERRGIDIGSQKTVWNRLWHAKRAGALVHYPKPGYWPADLPPPESASERGKAEKDAARPPEEIEARNKTISAKLKGRRKLLSHEQLSKAIEWVIAGDKLYCGPVLRHPAELIQAANDRSAVAV